MNSAFGRRVPVVGAVVAGMVFVVGCGGGAEGDSAAKAARAEAKASAEALGALPAADLEKVSLKTGDVKGHRVKKPAVGDLLSQDRVTVDNDACAPIGHAVAGTVIGQPAGTANRQTVTETDALKKDPDADAAEVLAGALDLTTVMVTLASYEGDGAVKAMTKLSDAADSAACAKGFALTMNGTGQKVTKVAKVVAPQGADQALGLTVTGEQEGTKVPMKVVVVRKGGTLGYFSAMNLASADSGKDFAFPNEVVEAQLVKLG